MMILNLVRVVRLIIMWRTVKVVNIVREMMLGRVV